MPRTLSSKQKKIARVASPRNKITRGDIITAATKKKKKKNGTRKKSTFA